MDQQNEGNVALPPGSKEETFTIAVYDNIDQQEETLSGKFMVWYSFLFKLSFMAFLLK